jgi:hypothetical protein
MSLAVKGFISARVHSVDWIYSMLPIITGYPNSNCIRNLSNDFFSPSIERNQTGGMRDDIGSKSGFLNFLYNKPNFKPFLLTKGLTKV